MGNLKIDYVEFQTPAIDESKAFFAKAFGWSYVDYGPFYADIQGAGLSGGLDGGGFEGDESVKVRPPLIVLKADDLDAAQKSVEDAGGEIIRAVYSFPGGRRFHFREPGGNELAVWSEK